MAARRVSYNTITEAADYFGTTPRTVRSWIATGKITAYRMPGGRSLRVHIAEIEAQVTRAGPAGC